MVQISIDGGKALAKKLREIASKLEKASTLNVGFLEGADYPDGTPVASIAAIQEWGATIDVAAHTQTIYRQTNKKATAFNKKGRFVKKSQSNFASEHSVAAHTITIPARPFFRSMAKSGQKHWADDIGQILPAKGYDAELTMNLMGKKLKGELQDSIRNWSEPPNAPSTIAKKGFDKPLIDTGDMLRAVGSEVTE